MGFEFEGAKSLQQVRKFKTTSFNEPLWNIARLAPQFRDANVRGPTYASASPRAKSCSIALRLAQSPWARPMSNLV